MTTSPLAGWDRDVLDAIVSTGDRGAAVEDILGGVDARQKIVLGLGELNGSLARLVAQDLVVQRANGRFAVPAGNDPMSGPFEPLDQKTYDAAIAAYRAWFIETLRGLDDELDDPDAPAWPKLSGTWRLGDDHYATDLEVEGLWSVVGRIIDALNSHGFKAMPGPSSGGPGTIEFAVYARQSDGAEAMLRIARPLFAAAASPSSMIDIDEWDPRSVGPSMADVADELEKATPGDTWRLPPSA